MPRQRYVGITGTNGKSTTTTLIAHILRQGGKRVYGRWQPRCRSFVIGTVARRRHLCARTESYQLELTPSAICDVAILLNITPTTYPDTAG